jgi:hypothetical protein
MITRQALLILLFSCCGFSAMAETLATCGASSGHAYYLEQGLVSRKDAGWAEDKISQGSFSLVKNGEALDILYKDSTGKLASSVSDGGRVIFLGANASNASVLVSYEGVSTEIYTFDFVNKVSVWSQHKYGALVNKGATYFAKCQ